MTKKNNFYNTSGSRKEIDLRSEFQNTMYGSQQEIAKGQPGLLRAFRKDSNGNKILCDCVSPVTGEADRERLCPVCMGEKYLWDETNIDFYVMSVEGEAQLADRESLKQPGILNTPFMVFYVPSSYNLTDGDKIVRLVLDKDGKAASPLKRRDIFRLSSIRDMRLDEGRLEFWKASGYEDNIKHL